MEDNKKWLLFPFRWSSAMRKITNTVEYWIINWFLSENNKIMVDMVDQPYMNPYQPLVSIDWPALIKRL